MKVKDLQAKLIAAARKNSPGEQVPYAFEKRIISHLSARPASNVWTLWCRPLWQAAISCIAITLLCGLWAYSQHPKADATEGFSQAFEAAVCAPIDDRLEETW